MYVYASHSLHKLRTGTYNDATLTGEVTEPVHVASPSVDSPLVSRQENSSLSSVSHDAVSCTLDSGE